jgi:hypothetical protein
VILKDQEFFLTLRMTYFYSSYYYFPLNVVLHHYHWFTLSNTLWFNITDIMFIISFFVLQRRREGFGAGYLKIGEWAKMKSIDLRIIDRKNTSEFYLLSYPASCFVASGLSVLHVKQLAVLLYRSKNYAQISGNRFRTVARRTAAC